jgi:hypothetical protein
VVRRLGHVLTLGVGLLFGIFYVLPPLLRPQSPDVLMIDLVKRSSLVKAFIILILVAGFRYFRLPVGGNVSGLLLGFSIYVATNVANFGLLEQYGVVLYERVFTWVGPLSYLLCLTVWTVATWGLEPVRLPSSHYAETAEGTRLPVGAQLGKFETALDRLFRR